MAPHRPRVTHLPSKSSEGYLWTPMGAIHGLETNAVITSSPHHSASYDCIVIGAGFAGLVAARDVSQLTRARVLLIEARDRIGGRTWTARVDGENIEMGGTWVHWNQPHVYNELHRYELQRNLKSSAGTLNPTVQFYKPAGCLTQSHCPAEFNEKCERTATKFVQIDGFDSRSLMPYPHDPLREPALWKRFDHLSVRERLDQMIDVPQEDRDQFESLVNTIGSAPGTAVSFTEFLRWYALGGHSLAGTFELAGIYKLGNGGMTSLALSILDDFHGDVMLHTVVEEICHGVDGVIVKTRSGETITAKTVISTIPLNCLKDISFHPPLSSIRQEAIQSGHMNTGAKIHFKLSATEPGWFAACDGKSDSPYVFAFSDHNGTKGEKSDETWCIGFGYGGHLKDMTNSSHIIEEFKRNVKANAAVELYATHDWINDPYAKGTWSCWGPGAMSRYLAELQKGEGRLLFASADWADGWRGFVDGAIESGKKAARDSMKVIGTIEHAKL